MKQNLGRLCGLRILNTRPLGQQHSLSQAIQTSGGVSVELPALNIEPSDENWLEQLPALTDVDQCIFISTNAVHYFFNTLKKNNLEWNHSIQTIAIGQATALALQSHSIAVNQIPQVADSEHLLALPSLLQVKDQTILLIKGMDGKFDIAQTLYQRKAHCIPLSVYQRVLPTIDHQKIQSIWKENLIDIILLTSQEAMQNIFTLFGPEAHPWLCYKPCMVISKRLANIAQNMGFKTILVSPYENLLDAFELYIKNAAR